MIKMRRKIRPILMYVALFLVMFGVGFAVAKTTETTTSALDQETLLQFSQSNILFYNPDEGNGNNTCRVSGGRIGAVQACGDTGEDMLWSALITAGFTDVQAAGIIANIYHETGYDLNPVRHGYAYFYDPASKGETNDCWRPVDTNGDGLGECNSYNGAGDVRPNSNIIMDENGHWDLFQNTAPYENGACHQGNKCQSYGIGLIGNAYGWRVDLLTYIKDKAPELFEFFYHPELYNSLSADQLIAAIGRDNVAAIFEAEIEQLIQYEPRRGAIEQIKAMTDSSVTPADVAGVWSTLIEGCNNCGVGQSGYIARQGDAQAIYERHNGQRLCSGTAAVVSGLRSPAHEWLDGAGLEGFTITKAANSGLSGDVYLDSTIMNLDRTDTYKEFAADAGGGAGLPGFIILHWTAGGDTGGSPYVFCSTPNAQGNMRYCPPHFTIDLVNRRIYQHVPLSHPSGAAHFSPEDGTYWDSYAIQIEVIGTGNDAAGPQWNIYNFTEEQYDYLAKLLIAISDETGIPLQTTVEWDENAPDIPTAELKNYIGVVGHEHVPQNNGKIDPGKMWYFVEPALQRMNYQYKSQGAVSTCSTNVSYGKCFQLNSEGDGGCTEDGYTYFLQAGPTWGSTPYLNNDGSICYDGGVDSNGNSLVGTVGSSGCAPATMAMIATALTGQMVNPADVANIMSSVGGRACGVGSDGLVVPAVAERLGLKAEHISDPSVSTITSWLNRGAMIILSVGGEYATEKYGTISRPGTGHFIAIRGISEDGKWYSFDASAAIQPGDEGKPRSDRKYNPIDVINAYTAHLSWSGGNMFAVYK